MALGRVGYGRSAYARGAPASPAAPAGGGGALGRVGYGGASYARGPLRGATASPATMAVSADAALGAELLAGVAYDLGSPYVGLGGIYGVAIAYWGLRALNAAAAAARVNAIQVRRASDNATQNITVMPNGALDIVSLTAFLAGTTGYVATWYDQSGNGYHMTQAVIALQPQIVLNAIGNLPAVLF